MPLDTAIATKVWNRYAFARDNGHNDFVTKAELCDRYFRGDQWHPQDLAKLKQQRRPALTINKILSTMSNVFGEQIYNRSEISYQPKGGSPSSVAEALTKVAKYVGDNNQLNWKRSSMFVDGCITSRGFLDMRLAFNDSLQGDIVLENLNPKNVIVDPDAEHYDPDTWKEVFVTKWMTADDIAILYSKEDAELLRNREQSFFPYGYDSIQSHRDRFGDRMNPMYNGTYDESSVMRSIRVIERQHRMLDRQKFFVSPETGEMREIPKEFSRDRIAWFVEKFGFNIMPKLVHRIRWTVIADNVALHDDWSPYKHFTVIPFFPYFRYGQTIGLVENLVGPQELLNKVSSQELHVINTTANSGWKVKAGALANMSVEELEQRGAETGLVIEVNGDTEKDISKIAPNTVPQGLDRVSYKAEEHIKTISGVPDSVQGQAREDVAAKAIQANRQAASTNQVMPMDSLARTDFILARNMLDIVQEYFTEPRLLTIIKDEMTADPETVEVNKVDATGAILNDLTLGEYGVIVTSVPQRQTLEDSQFDQAMAMREAGIAIPDDILIENSRLFKKGDIVKKMRAATESQEAQEAAALQKRGQEAEVAKTEGEAAVKAADAELRKAKTEQTVVETQKAAMTPPEDNGAAARQMEVEADIALDDRRFEHEVDLDERKFAHETRMNQQNHEQESRLREEQAQTERAIRVQTAAQQAANPQAQPNQGTKK